MTLKNIESIISECEGTTIEFKEYADSDRIINTIIAFANGAGGNIVIGVRDGTREVIGVEDPEKVEELLTNKIADTITLPILPTIYITSYRGVFLVVVIIYPSPRRPHFKIDGKKRIAYIRIGSSTRVADEGLIESLKRPNYDKEPCHEIKYEDIDLESARILLGLPSVSQEINENSFISLGILAKYTDVVMPSIGGAILFGKNRLSHFPSAMIIVGIIEDNDLHKSPREKLIRSFFPDAIIEALDFIRQNISVVMRVEGVHHKKLWEIPELALREALINAVVHTDYHLHGAPIRISVFHDRIEIENSATLLSGFTFEDLKNRISVVRNHVIARFFKEIGLIEQWGSGITKMIKSCSDVGLPAPIFEEIGSRIRVTFSRYKEGATSIDDTEGFIMGLIALCGPLSTHNIAATLSKSKRFVIGKLAALVAKGEILEMGFGTTDPKKLYNIRGGANEVRERISKMIIDMQWDHENSPPNLKVYIALGRERICLVLKCEDIDDFFVEGGFGDADKREKDVKNVLLSSQPELGRAIVNALGDEKIQKILKQKQTPKILLIAANRRGLIDSGYLSGADVGAAFPITSPIGFRKH